MRLDWDGRRHEAAFHHGLLGEAYRAQGKYDLAEPLYRRSVSALEVFLGRRHIGVAEALDEHAGLLREMKRDREARRLEARAKAIRRRQAKSK
jgi:tetratricopeptide repeat protein